MDSAVRTGGVPGAAPGALCPWPNVSHRHDGACNGSYAQPVPEEARALFTELFARARRAHGMVAFEQDFVADNTLRFGWRRQLGAAAQWLSGLAAAAAATRTPVQLCLATAAAAPTLTLTLTLTPTLTPTPTLTHASQVQLCLATASDLMHSLASPWVTQARAITSQRSMRGDN